MAWTLVVVGALAVAVAAIAWQEIVDFLLDKIDFGVGR